MKLAAERLFKIAEDLEREAADNTFFVCEGCNHTSSLADINSKRKVAGETNKVKRIACVGVNDKVSCPACGDKMSYVPTEMSEKYYVEADNEDVGADIFEPVDEQGKDETSDAPAPEGDAAPVVDESAPEGDAAPAVDESAPAVDEKAPETPESDTPETSDIADYDGNPIDGTPTDEPKPEEGTGEPAPEGDAAIPGEPAPEGDEAVPAEPAPEGDVAAPAEGMPEDAPTGDIPEGDAAPQDENPVEEETVPEDGTGEPAPEGDTADEPVDENGVEIPKKDVPKFEKIPKDASDDFMRAVAKYSF